MTFVGRVGVLVVRRGKKRDLYVVWGGCWVIWTPEKWVRVLSSVKICHEISWMLQLTLLGSVVTICTTSLAFKYSTFCPHSEFLCFVWISEQAAIISLYNINWVVCITETECVYCAIRTESLSVIHLKTIHHRCVPSIKIKPTYSSSSTTCILCRYCTNSYMLFRLIG